jgi:uncharacterized FlgJ-related protein
MSKKYNKKGYFNVNAYINYKDIFKKINIDEYQGKNLYFAKMFNSYQVIAKALLIAVIALLMINSVSEILRENNNLRWK